MDRQKIILIFGGAWLSAALLTWFVYSRATASSTGKMVQVVAAARDLPAGTRLSKSDLKRISLPESEAPKTVLTDQTAALDRVLLHPISAGEPILSVKTTNAASADGIASLIQPGMRAISLPINDSTSAGGLIQPRSRVDVLFTRTGTMREALTSNIAQNVQVISIGRVTEVGQQAAAQTGSQMRAATVLVTPEQASKLELARNQGKISLVLRNPLDKSSVESVSATAESLDPLLFAGASRALRASVRANVPNVRDEKVWAQLTDGGLPAQDAPSPRGERKEAPKPRYVVDVYHGDKHVQELFQ